MANKWDFTVKDINVLPAKRGKVEKEKPPFARSSMQEISGKKKGEENICVTYRLCVNVGCGVYSRACSPGPCHPLPPANLICDLSQ